MADENAQNAALRVPTMGLSGFVEKRPPFGAGRTTAPRMLRNWESVEYVKCTPARYDAANLINSCIIAMNLEETEHYQACAYYLSVLSMMFPDLDPVARDVLHNLGFTPTVITSDNMATMGFQLYETHDSARIYVMVGQLLFLLYKNISEASYDRFMRQRTQAIKAMVGLYTVLLPDQGGDVAVLSLARADAIRKTLGAQYELKKRVLEVLLASQSTNTPAGQLCAYVSGMLSWHEMSSILFVYESFCLTKSPVLRDIEVRDELRNLYKAFNVIIAQEMPQYFRILNPYSETRIIEKSKFPVLASVAQIIRAQGTASIGQFAQPVGVNPRLIDKLLAIHRNHIARTQVEADHPIIEFMYNADEMDNEHRARGNA